MKARRRPTAESREALRQFRAELTDPAPVMNAAAEFLAARPRSVDETTRRLRHLGYPDVLVEHVVSRLVEMKYLDDAEFTRSWVDSRDRARPRGETALRRELALKGIARGVVDEVLQERGTAAGGDGADRTAAAALLERRRKAIEREPDLYRRRQKAYALLARNGFDPETCREVSARLVADSADDAGTSF